MQPGPPRCCCRHPATLRPSPGPLSPCRPSRPQQAQRQLLVPRTPRSPPLARQCQSSAHLCQCPLSPCSGTLKWRFSLHSHTDHNLITPCNQRVRTPTHHFSFSHTRTTSPAPVMVLLHRSSTRLCLHRQLSCCRHSHRGQLLLPSCSSTRQGCGADSSHLLAKI